MTEEVTREAIEAAVKVAGDYRMRRLRYMMDHPELIGCGMDEGYPEELWREAEMRDVLLAASQSRPTKGAAPSASGRGMVAEEQIADAIQKSIEKGCDITPAESLIAARAVMVLFAPPDNGWVLVPKEPTKEMNLAAEVDCRLWWTKGRTTPIYGHEPSFVYRAMLASAPAPSPSPDNGWLPIESAPKDEMFIWARPKSNGEWGLGLAYRNVSGGWSDAYGNSAAPREATHWHQLPPPPAQGGGK